MSAVEVVHGPGCACHRCLGMQRGNQLARTHGGYSLAGIEDRGTEIADQIRPTLPAYSLADEPIVQLLGLTLARVERGVAALKQVDAKTERNPVASYLVDDALKYARLREDVRSWVNTARRLLNDLGATAMARAKLGLDIAATRRELSVIEYYEQREAAGLPLFVDEEDDE